MTIEELTEIEARANAATEGPWACVNEPELSSVVATSMPDTDGKHYGIALIPHWSPECDSIDWNVKADNAKFIAAARTDVPALTAALREAWADSQQAELWRERGIAEWQGAVETLQAENERLKARIAELECLLVSWHYGPTMQDTSSAFRSLKEMAKSLTAKQEAEASVALDHGEAET